MLPVLIFVPFILLVNDNDGWWWWWIRWPCTDVWWWAWFPNGVTAAPLFILLLLLLEPLLVLLLLLPLDVQLFLMSPFPHSSPPTPGASGSAAWWWSPDVRVVEMEPPTAPRLDCCSFVSNAEWLELRWLLLLWLLVWLALLCDWAAAAEVRLLSRLLLTRVATAAIWAADMIPLLPTIACQCCAANFIRFCFWRWLQNHTRTTFFLRSSFSAMAAIFSPEGRGWTAK